MKIIFYIFFYSFLVLLLHSCIAGRQKKSADYYLKNETDIQEILKLYEKLYHTQPFSLGFSDRSYRYVGMDITTDSVRYALNNEQSETIFFNAIQAFKYDTVNLRRLFVKMKKIKSIWLGKEQFYYNGKEEQAVFLSFRSALVGNPFLDRKYYMLIIFEPRFINAETAKYIEKKGYKKINSSIYYTIAGSFR